MRAALDTVFLMLGGSSGQIRGDVLGPAVLTKGLAQYANIEPSDTALIVLGAPRHEVEDTLSVMSYQQVVTLTTGCLARFVGPFRSENVELPADLPTSHWEKLGYVRQRCVGLQGVGSFSWAVAHKFTSYADRPDLGDRCRIAMIRSLVAARPTRCSCRGNRQIVSESRVTVDQDAIVSAILGLDRWFDSLRVEWPTPGYGGPVVHWWNHCLGYQGTGLDWRYEGIIAGYLALWERTDQRVWLDKAVRAGKDLVNGQLPDGSFRNSRFELNPGIGGTPMRRPPTWGC